MTWSSTRTPRREDAGARLSPGATRRALSRRTLIGGAAAVTGASLMSGLWPDGASAHVPGHGHHPKGPGSVSGAPNLPAGFTDTFTSRYVDTGTCACTPSSAATARRCCWSTAGPRPGTRGGC